MFMIFILSSLLRVGLSFGKVPIREFLAVSGGEASLPCNIAIPKDPELISLILWFRDGSKSPIYTLDFRKGLPEQAKHFPGKTLKDRSYFDITEYPPTLKIKPTHVDDEGIYKCRIEYKRSRIDTRIVKLNIIVPPQTVVIMDDRGQKLKNLAGPYDEGTRLSLNCEAEGGNPSPVVTWWKNGHMFDDTYFQTSKGFVRNELVIKEIRRSDFMLELVCQASNTNLTDPLSTSVYVDLNLRPLYVHVTTSLKSIKAGADARLDCETSGSRPAAKLSWWIDNKIIQNNRQSFFVNRNITYSSFQLTATAEDNGKTVLCKAENPALPNSIIQDAWTLNVLFPPQITLQVGANIKYSTIKEGNDVYLECVTKANPPIRELTWFFDGIPFYGNASAGVLISNQSLVLQKVRKENRGKYKCSAANTEGKGESSVLSLEVRYAPTCKGIGKPLYGVARGESVNIICDVDADPDDIIFRWALNNSVENVELMNFTSKKTRSKLTVTPKVLLDFGVVMCWGTNAVGEQKEPCISRIIQAGPPDPVRNCVIANRSQSWIMVECEPGYNGGLPQKFHMDVYNSAVDYLHFNLTNEEFPAFSVTKLAPNTPFVLVASASNEKGRSNSVALMGSTLSMKDEEQEAAFMGRFTLLVAVMIAALSTMLAIGVVALALVQIRRRRLRKAEFAIEEDTEKVQKTAKKKVVEDITDFSVACPDVVPPNNDCQTAILADCQRLILHGRRDTYVCDSESVESATIQEGQSPESIKCSRNYRNCVVALKRSWSLKKKYREKEEIEVSLAELNYPDDLPRIPLSPTTIIKPSPWYGEEHKSSNSNTLLSLKNQEDHAVSLNAQENRNVSLY